MATQEEVAAAIARIIEMEALFDELLQTLKRGVLSEDGLYNLLCDVMDAIDENTIGKIKVLD